MRIDKKIRMKLISSMLDLKLVYAKQIDNSIIEIEEAEQVEDIMSEKQWLLKKLVLISPLESQYCYFCVLGEGCYGCKYAKVHRRCLDEDSDFQKICDARKAYLDAIDEYYYKDEEVYK